MRRPRTLDSEADRDRDVRDLEATTEYRCDGAGARRLGRQATCGRDQSRQNRYAHLYASRGRGFWVLLFCF